MKAVVGALLFCFLLLSTSGAVRIFEDEANNFLQSRRFFGNLFETDINHECYTEEKCDFHEVTEALGKTEKAYEYWNKYQCKKFKKGCKDGACKGAAIGMESQAIPDDDVTASSWMVEPHKAYHPSEGRLNNKNGTWCKASKDKKPFIQVNLGKFYEVCSIATQGSALHKKNYVTKYTMQTSLNGEDWTDYKEGEKIKVFTGNENSKDVHKNNLGTPTKAAFVRFSPVEWRTYVCMRVEVYGKPLTCTVKTTKKKCCVFPFIYEGEKHYKCVKTTLFNRWCATTGDYDEDKEWGTCAE